MTDYALICSKVQLLQKKYGTKDPYELCDRMDISVMKRSMGNRETDCKGFFVCYCRIPLIMINRDLSEETQRIICAHELGHAVLHRSRSGVQQFHDVALFDAAGELEKEANIFAAELLLSDEDVNEVLNGDMTFSAAAASLYVPVDLLDFKFRAMKWKGYKLMVDTPAASNNFLKDLKDGGTAFEQ